MLLGSLAFFRGHHQRSVAVLVGQVLVSPGLQQQAHDFHTTLKSSEAQGSEAGARKAGQILVSETKGYLILGSL